MDGGHLDNKLETLEDELERLSNLLQNAMIDHVRSSIILFNLAFTSTKPPLKIFVCMIYIPRAILKLVLTHNKFIWHLGASVTVLSLQEFTIPHFTNTGILAQVYIDRISSVNAYKII